jgi:hypothetical protein
MFGISEPKQHTACLSSLASRLNPSLLAQLYTNVSNKNFKKQEKPLAFFKNYDIIKI